ncbi:GtrA family protein [Zymomonas mobilis]|nr:GtrA family protein [Zymomonas mobilis]MDX5948986.1 GtrA family protein [Zymomonas mobilis subsp. pomaceae]GEB88791.1 hypothetical protein ZMO02_04280 [Zymomonas mobilis subsp. pomaceae]
MMIRLLKTHFLLNENIHLLAGQVVRFGITGGLTTLINAGIYYGGIKWIHLSPLLANFIGYLVAMITGYIMHSRFSFRGHGCQDSHWQLLPRFFLASLLSLAGNSFWVWLLVDVMHQLKWTPLPFMIFVTPLLSFWLNRQWVFHAHSDELTASEL